MAVTVLTHNNFGSTISTTTEATKFNVKVDNVTIVAAADGTLSAVGGAVPKHIKEISRTGNDLVVVFSDSTTKTINVCCAP